MPTATERLAAAMAALPFAQLPQAWEGGSPLNIPGMSSVTRDDPWDVQVTEAAPDLTGENVRFAVTGSGVTVTTGDVSISALQPLAQALARQLDAPFWAVAVPDEGDNWTAAGTAAEVLEVNSVTGEEVEASRVGGVTSARIDGEDADLPVEIAALLDHATGDAAILAHRFAGGAWVAEIYAL